MFLWLYDLPTWLVAFLIVGTFLAASIAGLYATRGLVRRITGPPPGHNEGVDAYIGTAALFYGLIAGLIAVAVWEQYSTSDANTSQEASRLGAIYTDVRTYPEPYRSEITGQIRAYTRYLIDDAWPQYRQGTAPVQGVHMVRQIETTLYSFEPRDEREKLVDASAISEFNAMLELRRQRLYSLNTGLPSALWIVIVVGGVVTIVLTYFLALERFQLHVVMTGFCAVMVSLMIFMVFVVDHPFRGDVSIGPDAFQLIYDQLMEPDAKK
jgi:hypothetical protein